jgi:predicted O-methyltransferase YrrM
MPLPQPGYFEMRAAVKALSFNSPPGETDYYPGPMLGAEALGARIVEEGSRYVRAAQALLARLSPDDYLRYVLRYYETGLERFGQRWAYADIVTVLIGLAEALSPEAYLEVGVRRGRSACAVGSVAPSCSMALFDMWLKDYAGMDNPGPDLVRSELAAVGHRGPVEFVDGNSHLTLPRYLAAHPDAAFDIVTVDGDHTDQGAAEDLAQVLPRLKIGGAIVFDDIAHPLHPGLADIWRRMVEEDRRFSSYAFRAVGYGVGFAIRKY